jgi:hypothetical protein
MEKNMRSIFQKLNAEMMIAVFDLAALVFIYTFRFPDAQIKYIVTAVLLWMMILINIIDGLAVLFMQKKWIWKTQLLLVLYLAQVSGFITVLWTKNCWPLLPFAMTMLIIITEQVKTRLAFPKELAKS